MDKYCPICLNAFENNQIECKLSCGHCFCTSCIKNWFKIPEAISGRTLESEERIGELRPPQSRWRPRTNQQQEVTIGQEISVPEDVSVPLEVSVPQEDDNSTDTQVLETSQSAGSDSNVDEVNYFPEYQLPSGDAVKAKYQCPLCRANSC